MEPSQRGILKQYLFADGGKDGIQTKLIDCNTRKRTGRDLLEFASTPAPLHQHSDSSGGIE